MINEEKKRRVGEREIGMKEDFFVNLGFIPIAIGTLRALRLMDFK